jgi:hypothetical protein
MKVFTEVVETSKKTDVERYKSYDGKLFYSDKKACEAYESALTKVNTIALTTSNDCRIVDENSLYNGYAGCEDYCYLVAKVTEHTKTPLKLLFRASHHRHNEGEFEQLEFEKKLKEGAKLVFSVGCLNFYDGEVIDEFEEFRLLGTVEEYKKTLTKGFSLLDLD